MCVCACRLLTATVILPACTLLCRSAQLFLYYQQYSKHMHTHALTQPSGVTLPLPPKKMFGNTDRQLLVERQQKLQQFLEAILADPLLGSYFEVKRFLDPHNYSVSFSGEVVVIVVSL